MTNKTLRELAVAAKAVKCDPRNSTSMQIHNDFHCALTPDVILALLDKQDRMEALLREAVRTMKYHTDQTRPIERTFDTMDRIKEVLK